MLETYRDWVFDQAVPTWQRIGFDPAKAMFHERLDRGGQPLAVPHRAMVQARQIYVFSHAGLLGLTPGAADLAMTAMATLRARFGREEDEGLSFAYSIDPASGAVVSDARDSYTHAFLLFACAYLYRATGDADVLAMADGIARFVDARLVDPVTAGVVDALPPASASDPKRQNPQMHLLEAYLALEEAAPGRGYLDRAMALVTLFQDKLLDRNRGVLIEHYAADWSTHPDAAKGAFFEPGHHYEWIWLLEQAQLLSGRDLAAERAALFESASQHGHAATRHIFDEVDGDGTVRTPSHRLWPHTEAIKAAATMRRAGQPGARDLADAMSRILLDTFVARPFAGGWIDHVGPTFEPRVDYVPASSLYHLFLAAAAGEQPLSDAETQREAELDLGSAHT
jgi:mannose-6-phosphate isomerase